MKNNYDILEKNLLEDEELFDEFENEDYEHEFLSASEEKYNTKDKKRKRRKRKAKYKKHLKQLVENYSDNSDLPCPAIYKDKIWRRYEGYVEKNPKPFYKRLYRSTFSSYFKKQAHRKVRYYKKGLSKGNSCHKLYDYSFNIF